MIAYKGGECQDCGYNKPCLTAYHFHHLDPKAKDFTISGKSWSAERLRSEADKCVLLCSNCHAERHDGEYVVVRELEFVVHEDRLVKPRDCPQCLTPYKPTYKDQVCCSDSCMRLHARKVKNRPSRTEIDEMLKTMSWCAIAREYGVSDTCIRKWHGGPIIWVKDLCEKTEKALIKHYSYGERNKKLNSFRAKYPEAEYPKEIFNGFWYDIDGEIPSSEHVILEIGGKVFPATLCQTLLEGEVGIYSWKRNEDIVGAIQTNGGMINRITFEETGRKLKLTEGEKDTPPCCLET